MLGQEQIFAALESRQPKVAQVNTALTSAIGSADSDIDLAPFDVGELSSAVTDLWSILPYENRRRVAARMRALTSDDDARTIAHVVRTLRVLVGLPTALGRVQRTASAILEQQRELLAKVDQVSAGIDRLQATLDEQLLRTARAAIDHLLSAVNASVDSVRDQQLQMAASRFTELANLHPAGSTSGTSGRAPNAELIALGRWGNHLYYGVQGDMASAMGEVYACAVEHPFDSVKIFPADYFSDDFRSQVGGPLEKLENVEKEVERVHRHNLQSSSEGVRFLKGAGGAVVGFIATAWWSPAIGVAVGASAARSAAGESRIDPQAAENAVAEARRLVDLLANKITADARGRLEALNLLTLPDLVVLANRD